MARCQNLQFVQNGTHVEHLEVYGNTTHLCLMCTNKLAANAPSQPSSPYGNALGVPHSQKSVTKARRGSGHRGSKSGDLQVAGND